MIDMLLSLSIASAVLVIMLISNIRSRPIFPSSRHFSSSSRSSGSA